MNHKIFRCLILLSCCFVHFPAIASTDTLLTILNPDDAGPPHKYLLAQQSFTGNDPKGSCAYYELLQNAKSTAKTLGANVVKVKNHRKRNQDEHCDAIEVAFYKVEDLRAIERHFSWSPGRALSWDDFKGSVPGSAGLTNAAVTSCGIAMETNTVVANGNVKVYVFNSFETNTSWVRPEQRKHAVLVHEQGHFDICELYTRKMRERYAKAHIDAKNLQGTVQSIYNTTMEEYAAYQTSYERETQHGIIEAAQQEWTEKIARELGETESWSSN